MGWLSGLLTGYSTQQGEIRKENALRDIEASKRESKVYETLLNSEDPEVRSMAATGMLQMGQPRRRAGGLGGWMGEMQSSPIYPTLMRYMSTPQFKAAETTPGLPSKQTMGGVSLPGGSPWSSPSGHDLSLPDTSPTEGEPMATPQPQPGTQPPHVPLATSRQGVDPAQLGAAVTQLVTPPPAPPQHLATSRGGVDPALLEAAVKQLTPPPAPPGQAPAVAEAQPALAPDVAPEAPPEALAGAPPEPPDVLPTESHLTTTSVPGPAVGRVDREARYERPSFPSQADLLGQTEMAKVHGEIRGLQEAFKIQGDPDWQRKGVDAYMAQHGRGGLPWRPVTVEYTGKDGRVVQDLALLNEQTGRYYAQDGVTPLPLDARPAAKGAGATRALSRREEIAAMKYGDPSGNEDPIALNRRLTPAQRQSVFREEMIQNAEAKLLQAQTLANAPLTAVAKSELTEKLAADWRAVQKPQLEMARQLALMETSVKRIDQDPLGASQGVLVTFQKILDPTSVVRESEYARSAEGMPLVGRIQGMYDRLVKGGAGVPKAELQEMAETARQFLAGMVNFNDGERQRIEFRAGQHQIDPRGVFGNTVTVPAASSQVAQPPPQAPPTTAAPQTAQPNTAPGGQATLGKNAKGQLTITIP